MESENGFRAKNARNILLDDVHIFPKNGAAFQFENCITASVNKCSTSDSADVILFLKGWQTDSIHVTGADIVNWRSKTKFAEGASQKNLFST